MIRRAAPQLVVRSPPDVLFHLTSTLPAVRREARLVARASTDAEFCRRVVDERLVATVRHARAMVPFYRRSYDRALVDSFRGVEDLSSLPAIDRRAVQQKYHFVAADSAPLWSHRVKTSGSTGEPVAVLRDIQVILHEQAALRRVLRRAGRRVFTPFQTSFISLIHTPMPRSQRQPTMGFSRAYRFGLGEPAWQDPLDPLRFLASQSGYLLSAAPNMLMELYRHCSRHDPSSRYPIRPAVVLSSGGPLNEATREAAAGLFDCPVVDAYVTEEVGLIALECPFRHGFHIEAPGCVVECVRDDGSPADPGENGDLLVTGLRSRCFPLIRYRIGDTGSLLDGPCECGSSLPRLGRLIGRGGTFFLHRCGTHVAPASLGHELVSMAITQLQIEQLEIDRFEFRYVKAPGADEVELCQRVQGIFERNFGPQVDVAFCAAERLGKEGGKVRPYLSRLAPREPV